MNVEPNLVKVFDKHGNQLYQWESKPEDIIENTPFAVKINCDGYYPECGNCGYWFKTLEIGCKICPECNRLVDWRGLDK